MRRPSEETSTGFPSDRIRSTGTGTWAQEAGQTYLQRMIALILFDTPPNLPVSPGFFAGWQEVAVEVLR
jgi:hypothetical protein